MKLVVFVVGDSDTHRHLKNVGWADEGLQADLNVMTKEVEGESSHALVADALTADVPTSSLV